jgi:DNA-binding transcriptional regulator YiaG
VSPTVAEESTKLTACGLPSNLAKATFAEQAKCIRQLFGFTTVEFAKILTISEPTLKQWEAGHSISRPSPEESRAITGIIDIAEFLGHHFENDVIIQWFDARPKKLQGLSPKEFVRISTENFFDLSDGLGAIGR